MSIPDKNEQTVAFHPIVKGCAYFGVFVAIFAAIDSFFSIVAAETFWSALVAAGRAFGCCALAWAFWYAGKFSKNPLKAAMFAK